MKRLNIMKRLKQLIENLIYLSDVDLRSRYTKDFVKNWKEQNARVIRSKVTT